jgi:putative cell wall-binding protein
MASSITLAGTGAALRVLLALLLVLSGLFLATPARADESDGERQLEFVGAPDIVEETLTDLETPALETEHTVANLGMTALATDAQLGALEATDGPGLEWIKNYGGSDGDYFFSLVQTLDGGFAAVGESSSSNDDLSGNKGNSDFIIARFDANGNIHWIKNYGGSNGDHFESLVHTSDGGFAAAGWSYSSNGDLFDNKGGADFIIAKFSASEYLTRHAGGDRYHTSELISQATFSPQENGYAIVTTGENYPDALSASVLAGALEAPILITEGSSLNASTQNELMRLKPATVYIAGGTGSVFPSVEAALKSLSFSPDVIRIGGTDRMETSRMLAEETDKARTNSSNHVFLAAGTNFADALAVSPFAVKEKMPVLLTDSDTLSADADRYITQSSISSVTILGGTASVFGAIETQLKDRGIAVERIGGTDRYETAAMIAIELCSRYNINPSVIGIAKGTDYPDALCGGAALGQNSGILLLTEPSSLNASAASAISALGASVTRVEIFGGAGSVSEDTERAVRGLL